MAGNMWEEGACVWLVERVVCSSLTNERKELYVAGRVSEGRNVRSNEKKELCLTGGCVEWCDEGVVCDRPVHQ